MLTIGQTSPPHALGMAEPPATSSRPGTPDALFTNTSANSPYLTHGSEAERPAKKQKIEHNLSVTEIDENTPGDLVLKVGKDDDAMILRVHTSILKLASPVFRKMLSGEWKEGSNYYNASNPLPLPEDDPLAFHMLCKILHHQVDGRVAFSVAELRGLSIVADKYDCCGVLQPWIWSRLALFIDSTVKSKGAKGVKGPAKDLSIHDALCISYLLGDSTLFWKASQHVITCFDTVKLSERIHPELQDLMPAGFLGRSNPH